MGSGTRVADVPALPPALDVTQPAGVAPLPVAGTGGALGAAAAGQRLGPSTTTTMAPLTPSTAAATTNGGRYSSSISPPSAMAPRMTTRSAVQGESLT